MVKEYRNCDEVHEDFSALLDDELSPDEQAAVEAHLATCTECLRALNALKTVDNMFAELPPSQAPHGFEDRVMRDARNEGRGAAMPRARWSRSLRWTAFAAAAVLLLTAGVVVVTIPRQDESFTVANRPDDSNVSGAAAEGDALFEDAFPNKQAGQEAFRAPMAQSLSDNERGAEARAESTEDDAAPAAPTPALRAAETAEEPTRRMESSSTKQFDSVARDVPEAAAEAKPDVKSRPAEPSTTFVQNQGAPIRITREREVDADSSRTGGETTIEPSAETPGEVLDLTDTVGAGTDELTKNAQRVPMTLNRSRVTELRQDEQVPENLSAADVAEAQRVSVRLDMEDGVWTDPAYDGEETIALLRNSEAARNLTAEFPEIADFLKLTEAVIFRIDKTWYRVPAAE